MCHWAQRKRWKMSKWLEKEIVKVLDRLGKKACKKFGYSYASIKRLHPNDDLAGGGTDGYCVIDNKEIRIAIKKTKTKFYPMEELVDTLIHEIAHVKDESHHDEPTHHSAGWRERYRELKLWARKYIHD